MRVIAFVKSDMSVPPTQELHEAIRKLGDREMKAGRLLDTGGLAPPDQGAQVRLQNGKVSVLDGLFAESKEVIGGYAMFELRNMDEAVALAVELLNLHKGLCPGWGGSVELRPLAGP